MKNAGAGGGDGVVVMVMLRCIQSSSVLWSVWWLKENLVSFVS